MYKLSFYNFIPLFYSPAYNIFWTAEKAEESIIVCNLTPVGYLGI